MKEREIITASGATRELTEEDRVKATEAAKQIRADKKARFARILERGVLVDRLAVDLPPDLHGEWVPLDQVDRWLAMGFENGAHHVPKLNNRALHGAADGYVHVGDVVFLTLPKEDKELYEEVRLENYVRMHGSTADKKEISQREEKEFESLLHAEARELPVVEDGSAKAAKREEIRESLVAAVGSQPGLTSKTKS